MKKLILLLTVVSLASVIVIAGSSEFGCNGCHVPHFAGSADIGVPLWNPDRDRDMSHLTPYSSATLDAAPGTPDGVSKLCLSCHDGTGSYSAPGTGGNFDNDITNMHPVSFVYDSALATADGELNDPSATTPMGGTIADDLLVDGKVQCSSCHDPHSSAAVAVNILKISNTQGIGGGQLCKTCHQK